MKRKKVYPPALPDSIGATWVVTPFYYIIANSSLGYYLYASVGLGLL